MEEWKDIKGFEGYYQISNMGRVRSLTRDIHLAGNYHQTLQGKVMKNNPGTKGYEIIGLRKNGKVTMKMIHRLVAEAFVENPLGLPQVNHKDENIKNNVYTNLEWCTPKYNANYGTRNQRCFESSKKYRKPVNQLDIGTGELIKRWEYVRQAMRETGINDSAIIRVCKGRYSQAGGYKWEYATD